VREEDSFYSPDFENLGWIVESCLVELQAAVQQEAVIGNLELDAASANLLRSPMENKPQVLTSAPFPSSGVFKPDV
jgi:hypothetical protein